MATINFYLDKLDSKGRSPIFLVFRIQGKKFKTFTKEKVNPKYWDAKKQRVKSIGEASDINDQLDRLEEKLRRAHRSLKHEEVDFDINDVKTKFLGRESKKKMELFDYFDHFIELKRTSQQRKTLSEYNTIVNDLKEYEVRYNVKLSFQKIDESFISNYLQLLTVVNQNGINTIAKKISTLKTMLNAATEAGFNKSLKYLKFKVKKVETEKVSLTRDELLKLYQLDLKVNQRLEQVRDIFCFGCFTGLRFSDIMALQEAWIFEEKDEEGNSQHALNFHVKKTMKKLFVPLSPLALGLINKYVELKEKDNHSQIQVFPKISNQRMNDYLKEVGKLAGIDEPIVVTKFIGKDRKDISYKKYELLSSHAARRTFGNLSLEKKKMTVEVLKEIMGHASIRTTMKYLKTRDRQKSRQMLDAWEGFGEKS